MTDPLSPCAAILAWLATVQPSDAVDEYQDQAESNHPRKRRRIDYAESNFPLSPPVSHSTHSVHSSMESTPQKGRKRKHHASRQDNNNDNNSSDDEHGGDTRPHDINATPRASQLNDRKTPSLASGSTGTSRTSSMSPTKQLKRLALEADGFVHRKFVRSHGELPPSLAVLVKELKELSRGFRLIPKNMSTEVHSSLSPHSL